MSNLTRFSVSLDGDLLARFDRVIGRDGYPTRSKAIADLIAESLVREKWKTGGEVAAAFVLVYDHHKRNLTDRLTRAQHNSHQLILASQHVHLDHDTCLEIVVVRGDPRDVDDLFRRLRAIKGVKHCSLAAASTGSTL
jgi:CopG family nickel-responsive transcriptional regulator